MTEKLSFAAASHKIPGNVPQPGAAQLESSELLAAYRGTFAAPSGTDAQLAAYPRRLLKLG
jgi:hypothetical protein